MDFHWKPNIDKFDQEMMLLPVHLPNHLTLIVADFKNKKIQYYDLLGTDTIPPYLMDLFNVLNFERREKGFEPWDHEEWNIGLPKNFPKQPNGYDCGVCVCIVYTQNV